MTVATARFDGRYFNPDTEPMDTGTIGTDHISGIHHIHHIPDIHHTAHNPPSRQHEGTEDERHG